MQGLNAKLLNRRTIRKSLLTASIKYKGSVQSLSLNSSS